ncbi:hypothetical protein [Citrobacter portucalensis]|uniref:hypothetical protein n=1 Tax=Citrobacter portucalensis TaxID=1639133 RepID=UPI00254BE3C0|nr:hypothetical protein [Citrobacter portucalensis]EIP1106371.1 hypothetical protein [Citrobacter freundii]WOR30132.1 hypothetical protein R2X24_00345 [Citrobacter portucalensis]
MAIDKMDIFTQLDIWIAFTGIYILTAILTFIPIQLAILQKVELHAGGDSFQKDTHFNNEEKVRLIAHYSRIAGTLGFWKNQALKFKRFHYYVLCWTIPSSVLIPVLVQTIADDNYSKLFLTVVSSFTAILLAFHKGLKVEDNFKSYRHGESEFFDTYRRLLDRPNEFGQSNEAQLIEYFKQVDTIRKYVRNAETDNLAALDASTKEILSNMTKNNTQR